MKQYSRIARSDYEKPMFQLITIRQENGTYKPISRKGFGGFPLGFVERVRSNSKQSFWRQKGNSDQEFNKLQIGVQLYRRKLQSRTLLSIHISYQATPEPYTAFRMKYHIPEKPNMAFFRSLADEKNTFWG